MLPAWVSIRKPACPTLVTCTYRLPQGVALWSSLAAFPGALLLARRGRAPRHVRRWPRTRLTDVEPVYGTVIQAARLVWKVQGLKFTVTGVENLPPTGGAVIAINHTSYFDFTFAGLPAYLQGHGRKVRFMAKREVFDSKVSGPIIRSLRHIPVDCDS